MKSGTKRTVLYEMGWAAVIFAVCVGLLYTVMKNYREFEFTFKTLPYVIQGYPQDDVLLIGSSTMEFWSTSEADLGPLHTINAGVAGAKVENWRNHISDLVEPFHPRAIVIFIGSNDIDGSENSKSGEAVAEEMRQLFDEMEEALPGTPIYCISIAPTLQRWNVWDEASICNQLVKEMAEEREELHVIDCASVLLDDDGQPKSDIFRSDGLHFNEEGYRLWTTVIRPVLLEDLSEGGITE